VEARGVEPFLRDWLAQPLFAGVPATRDEVAQRARSHRAGELATMLRNLGTGTQEPLWNRLRELDTPPLLITGIDDAKFDAINDEMHAAMSTATRVKLPGGHALPIEQPRALADAIIAWLAR